MGRSREIAGKLGLLLCVLLLIVGSAELGVLLKARTAGSTDPAPLLIEARVRTISMPSDDDQPRQRITSAVKSLPPSLPPLSSVPPNEQPIEAQAPAMPAAFETIAEQQTPVDAVRKGARFKSRVGVRRIRLFVHRQAAKTDELQEIHASIRRPIQYGRCGLNNHQVYNYWGRCPR